MKKIEGLSKYQIHADGSVHSSWNKNGRVILKGGVDKDGYAKFVLIRDDRSRLYIRRSVLVCTAFHGPAPTGMEVRHLDGSRDNDAASNLEWATHADNCADKVAHGTAQRGEKNARAKLTKRKVKFIRAHKSRGIAALAKHYRVSHFAIRSVLNGRTWRHVT